jgi:RNA polymerase sigma factor (sigma-70 family)
VTEPEFAERWYPVVSAHARRMAWRFPNLLRAEDLTQMGMVAALEAFREWGGALPDAVLVTAVKRQMIDAVRAETRRPQPSLPVDEDAIAEVTPSYGVRPEDSIIRRIDRDRALALTDGRAREIFRRVFLGQTYDEISRAIGLTGGRISQIRSEAIRRIRRAWSRPRPK